MWAIVAAAGCRIEQTPRVDADDPVNVARAEIELTLREYEESLSAGDARGAAAVFTPGAQLYLPGADAINGRGEIDRAFAERFADGRIVDMTLDHEGIDVGVGVAHQFGTMRQRVREEEGGEHDIDGRFAIRWVRAGDSVWRIDRLLVHHAPSDSVPADSAGSTGS
ncbi:MAG TPA: DUF4440 domain-containing protein [Longimicrobiales bacterium]|nr:DUF4440 domain-containing protein [Longimicrobiales bacterium]